MFAYCVHLCYNIIQRIRNGGDTMQYNLSKSRYCSAMQCPKMLWLKKHKPEAFDESSMNQAVLDTGSSVGDLAMGLFGDYVEVPYGELSDMIAETKRLLDNQTPVIAEASFSVDGLFCSVDLLKCLGDNEVALYEVKSSTEVKEQFYDDVAFQYHVLTEAGLVVKSCHLVHINNQYVRQGELDIDQLFTIVDITDPVRNLYPEVATNIQRFRDYMMQTEEPLDDIGEQCFAPYDCGFWKYCTKHLPTPNVFDIAGAWKSVKLKCYRQGVISFEQLNQSDLLSAKYYKQIEHELYGYPPYIDTQNIKTFMDKLSYPIYFLDFESFQPAIPLFDDSRPYEQIVFQYSLHYIEEPNGELKHKEFLAYPGADPRRALAEQLCRDIPLNVCTTAYNMSFEKGRIKGLAELYPDLREHLMNIHDNIQDLMIPFQKKWYYTKAMQGSYSIKYVLPALFPNDPVLDYHNLEGVHNGGEAMDTYAKMQTMTPEEVEEARGHLLKYCELDTFAMVKIWERLKEVCE